MQTFGLETLASSNLIPQQWQTDANIRRRTIWKKATIANLKTLPGILAGNKLAAIDVSSFSSQMHVKRTAAALRAFAKPAIAGLLVLWLFLSALASASPCLHEWLHSDHSAPTHYCLVTALEHGQSNVTSVTITLEPVMATFPPTALPLESFFISHDTKLFPERGPPVLS